MEFASIDDFKVEQIVKMKQTPQKKKGGLKIKYISSSDMGSCMKARDDSNDCEDDECALKIFKEPESLAKAADL